MLVDFLKGNHFTISLATVSWLWGSERCLRERKGWITPMVGKTRLGFMAQLQSRGSPAPERPISLPQGQPISLRDPTNLPRPREVPGRGPQMLISAGRSCTSDAEWFQAQRTSAQQSQGQRTSRQGQCRLLQQRGGSERGFKTPRVTAEYWGRQRLMIVEFLRQGGRFRTCWQHELLQNCLVVGFRVGAMLV
jgi:hypothetical protein